MDTAMTTGAAPESTPAQSAQESVSSEYTRRSSVDTDDMIRFSRSDASSHSALYAGVSSGPGLISEAPSQSGFIPSVARYLVTAPKPGVASRAGTCSLSYQSVNSARSTVPGEEDTNSRSSAMAQLSPNDDLGCRRGPPAAAPCRNGRSTP